MAKIAALACVIICLVISHSDDCHGAQQGNLKVKALYAENLEDRDGALNKSDPYMRVGAIDDNGYLTIRTTSIKKGSHNPAWYETMDFGQGTWKYFEVRLFDSDSNEDDPLSGLQTFFVEFGHDLQEQLTVYCYANGKAYIRYEFK